MATTCTLLFALSSSALDRNFENIAWQSASEFGLNGELGLEADCGEFGLNGEL